MDSSTKAFSSLNNLYHILQNSESVELKFIGEYNNELSVKIVREDGICVHQEEIVGCNSAQFCWDLDEILTKTILEG